MHAFKVTKDCRVFLDDVEIQAVFGLDLHIDAGNDPEVVLRVAVDDVDIDGYREWLHTDWTNGITSLILAK